MRTIGKISGGGRKGKRLGGTREVVGEAGEGEEKDDAVHRAQQSLSVVEQTCPNNSTPSDHA